MSRQVRSASDAAEQNLAHGIYRPRDLLAKIRTYLG